MATCKDKTVLFSSYYLSNKRSDVAPSNAWSDYRWYANSNSKIILESKETIIKNIKSLESTLSPKSVLYFGKSSKFPRFKLTGSDFKRCIKLGKEDFIVVEDNLSDTVGTIYGNCVYEDSMHFYIFENAYEESIATTVGLFLGSNPKKVYSGEICKLNSKAGEDVENILSGNYKNIIYDKDLDKMISNNFDVLTEESIEDVEDMLQSNDYATKGIGLKLLSGYNLIETPLTANIILGKYPDLDACSEFRSIGVKQMLNSINWEGFLKFPRDSYALGRIVKNIGELTDLDKNLSRNEFIKGCKEYLDKSLETLNSGDLLKSMGIEINYEIK